MQQTVICPGSFDPITNGHLDIITRASKMFDKVIVAVVKNQDKHPSFTINERIALLQASTLNLPNVEIVGFDGMLAEYAKTVNAYAIVKGLRAVSDFEYEFQQALINRKLNPDLDTIFFTTSQEYMYLSSSIVKQVASLGGDISPFVPPQVCSDISKRLAPKS
ncbi:MAG: pantetheine-phosphate adenylyltransferase [Oscillospiraceae bacterium]|nr:pantetheine-phosphate adenylyltransferase [Oscillospiraceae bacterium]